MGESLAYIFLGLLLKLSLQFHFFKLVFYFKHLRLNKIWHNVYIYLFQMIVIRGICHMIFFLFWYLKVFFLLWKNTKFIILSCTIQWLKVHKQCCATTTTISSLFHCPDKSPIP